MKKKVFSGIQPTGNIHIGNYVGAIRNWVRMQDEYEPIYCIVDLHSITVQQEPQELKAKIRELAAILLAAGIDPQRSALFVQSHVKEHAELAWILNCLTPMGWMERMTQFKEKSEKQRERTSVGLFTYPALMAADILLYDTDLVPVGEDQKQHLELTRDLAQRFNHLYGDTFVVPEPYIPPVGARIMALNEPTVKMSKSEADKGGTIDLLDPPNRIRKKFMRAQTDSLRDVLFDEERPGVNNLLVIYETFSGQTRAEIEAHFAGKGYGDLKKELGELVGEALRPLRERYEEIMADPAGLDRTLAEGAERVRPTAVAMVEQVKRRMGLG